MAPNRFAIPDHPDKMQGGRIIKATLAATWVFSLATCLLIAGLATFWWSNDLMPWLIWMVGEEYALGEDNVIRLEGGGTLLTNPMAMGKWTMPFYLLGFVQISSAVTLVWMWLSKRRPAA